MTGTLAPASTISITRLEFISVVVVVLTCTHPRQSLTQAVAGQPSMRVFPALFAEL